MSARIPLRPRVAVIGSGISGLAAAHTLKASADVTLFEAAGYFGGHANTVDVTLPNAYGPMTHGVDTGFLVFNERTYPELIRLLGDLDVQVAKADMSFSVQVEGAFNRGRLEWSGSSLNTVFAQRSNLVRPGFLRMLRDLLRFNALATRIAVSGRGGELMQPLGDFLREHGFSNEFRDWYFLPMIGCIWSCPAEQMLQFPVMTMVRFCHNHGLLQVSDRPQWWTVAGGSRNYVERITGGLADARLSTPVRLIERSPEGVHVYTDRGHEFFDKVIIATHADQSLAMLAAPTQQERQVLGAIRYQPNKAVLHTDASVLPQRKIAWAAWNYERPQETPGGSPQVCLHYLLNMLQPLPWEQPVIVSLNPRRPIDPASVIGEFNYAHPVFDLHAVRAQAEMPRLQGQQHTWFCGAWMGYGFHEDGLKSGLQAARQIQGAIEAAQAGQA